MWSVHISEYHRSIKKNDLKRKVPRWSNPKEYNVENRYVYCDTIYISSKTHNKCTNTLWVHAFVARCIPSAQADTNGRIRVLAGEERRFGIGTKGFI